MKSDPSTFSPESEKIDPLLSSVLSGSADDETYIWFREWMKKKENKAYFRQYKHLWHLTNGWTVSEEEKQKALKRYKNYLNRSVHRHIFGQCLKYAAIICISFFAGYRLSVRLPFDTSRKILPPVSCQASAQASDAPVLIREDGSVVDLTATDMNLQEKDGTILQRTGERSLAYNRNASPQAVPLYHTIRIPRGERFRITLSDSTRVWLNSETTLKFPVNFYGRNRHVELSGQAYFEVQKDSLHPFTVKSGNLEVEVLGTSFDISAYPDSPESQVILVEGAVRANACQQQILLQPGELLSVNDQQQKTGVQKVNARALTAWKDGILRLTDQSFEEMLHKLERWYDITFINQLHTPVSGRFNGRFDRENVTEAIKTIAISAQIGYRIANDTIFIYPESTY